MKIQCEIFKGVPGSENGGFVTYMVDAEPNDMVLDVLESIYHQFDPTLAYRYACGIVRCGECAMRINGEPCMACDRKVEPALRIEPLNHLPCDQGHGHRSPESFRPYKRHFFRFQRIWKACRSLSKPWIWKLRIKG